MKPLKITLYDSDNNEVYKEFTQGFIPWIILKRTIQLSKSLANVDPESLTKEDTDSIASLVVDAFEGQFTLAELDDGADLGERLTVLQCVMSISQSIQNKPSTGEEPDSRESSLDIDDDWMVDVEVSLSKNFGWSLYEIDNTDISSLLPFIMRFNGPRINQRSHKKKEKVFCDQVEWL